MNYNGCCFNHIIGLPRKNGIEHPLYDYEEILFKCMEIPSYQNNTPHKGSDNYRWESLRERIDQKQKESDTPLYDFKVNHLAVLKSSGLGLTEFFLRYMAWLCVKDDKLRGSDMCILTGPRIDLATDLIARIKRMFNEKLGMIFDSKETVVNLNGVRISAFPSHLGINAARGLPSVSFLFCDEASYFQRGIINDVINLVERYAGKSRAKIVLLSTPHYPGDLLHQVLNQPWEKSFYKICKFNWEWGIGKIYSEEDIEIARSSVSFQQEYNLAFVGQAGDIINPDAITAAIELGKQLGFKINLNARHVMGVDPSAGGDSKYAIVVVQYDKLKQKIIQVTHAEQYGRQEWDYNQMIDRIMEINRECGKLNNIYVDGANQNVVTSLKSEFREDTNQFRIKEHVLEAKKYDRRIEEKYKVIPTSFGTESVNMLINLKRMIETPKLVAIHPKFEDLIISLRSAQGENWHLDKEESVNNDLLDALRLALQYFRIRK